MKIILVIVGDLYKFPPVLSILHAFEEMGIKTTVICTKPSRDLTAIFNHISFDFINIDYERIKSPFSKIKLLVSLQRELIKRINKYYDDNSLIWVETDVTLKYLRNTIISKNYVLHLMELSQDLLLYKKIPFVKLNASRLGNQAKAIIVPEYNRAHITAAWWNLEKLPYVLPNKPYYHEDIQKNSDIENDKAKEVINQLLGKKIIMYQGILSKERPLDAIIKAVNLLGEDYAFVVMSSNDDIYADIDSDNYYYIPYVRPPMHLQVTSHAYIGILSYVPSENTGYSKLNSLFCAPNKTYEFAMFGIPMIGNNNPGLRYLFDTEHVGCCFESFDPDVIADTILKIESEYDSFSRNSYCYYKNCDYQSILSNILNSI